MTRATTRTPGVHSVAELQNANHRADRRRTEAARTVAAMRRGAFLQRLHEHGRTIWRLSSGPFVTTEAADVVIHNPNIVGAGDCLFGEAGTSQTFRWADPAE
jgi:hypothetical protein